MFCSNCGKNLRENGKFCGQCGHPAPVPSSSAPSSQAPPQPEIPAEPANHMPNTAPVFQPAQPFLQPGYATMGAAPAPAVTKKKKKPLIITLAAVALAVVVLVVVLLNPFAGKHPRNPAAALYDGLMSLFDLSGFDMEIHKIENEVNENSPIHIDATVATVSVQFGNDFDSSLFQAKSFPDAYYTAYNNARYGTNSSIPAGSEPDEYAIYAYYNNEAAYYERWARYYSASSVPYYDGSSSYNNSSYSNNPAYDEYYGYTGNVQGQIENALYHGLGGSYNLDNLFRNGRVSQDQFFSYLERMATTAYQQGYSPTPLQGLADAMLVLEDFFHNYCEQEDVFGKFARNVSIEKSGSLTTYGCTINIVELFYAFDNYLSNMRSNTNLPVSGLNLCRELTGLLRNEVRYWDSELSFAFSVTLNKHRVLQSLSVKLVYDYEGRIYDFYGEEVYNAYKNGEIEFSTGYTLVFSNHNKPSVNLQEVQVLIDKARNY